MTRKSSNGFGASTFSARLRAVVGLCGLFASVLAAASTDIESTRSATAPVAKSRIHEGWRKEMSRAGAPAAGCFRADYPEKVWKAVPCTVAPLRPHPARRGTGPVSDAVGDGTDYSAELPGGALLSYGEGSFGTSAIFSESDGASDSYSLQLNANKFTTSACNGVPNCLGWQQYVFDNNPAGSGSASLYIQYWLINYPSNCPGGYTYYPGSAGSASGCYKNSAGVAVPVQALLNLSGLALTGTAIDGGLDQITLYTGTSIYSTYGEDTVLNASLGWTTAEFNVFGYDSNGPVATFSSGTLLSIETMVSNGVNKSAPVVVYVGETYESNNLTLAPLTCPVADPNGPYIWFQESIGATPATTCPITPISLAAPTVTTKGPTGKEIEMFSFSWPNVPGATYYVMTRNGAESTLTGNAASVGISCQQTVVVTFSSCDAAGCGWPETVLNAKNTSQCN